MLAHQTESYMFSRLIECASRTPGGDVGVYGTVNDDVESPYDISPHKVCTHANLMQAEVRMVRYLITLPYLALPVIRSECSLSQMAEKLNRARWYRREGISRSG